MKREQYDDYVAKFNARDYNGVFDFYAENPEISFFGIHINTRQELIDFYSFLHSYVQETITVEKYVSSDELIALEAVIKIEGIKDLDQETLQAKGFGGLFPIKAGDVQELKQYIHYSLENGKIKKVGCAIPLS